MAEETKGAEGAERAPPSDPTKEMSKDFAQLVETSTADGRAKASVRSCTFPQQRNVCHTDLTVTHVCFWLWFALVMCGAGWRPHGRVGDAAGCGKEDPRGAWAISYPGWRRPRNACSDADACGWFVHTQGGDSVATAKIAKLMIDLCWEARNLEQLIAQTLLLCKRRSQSSRVRACRAHATAFWATWLVCCCRG